MELPRKEWGWQYLPWDEHELTLSWPELKALKEILSVARQAKLGALPAAIDPLPDVPSHRLAEISRKVDEEYGDPTRFDAETTPDDGAAEDA